MEALSGRADATLIQGHAIIRANIYNSLSHAISYEVRWRSRRTHIPFIFLIFGIKAELFLYHFAFAYSQ